MKAVKIALLLCYMLIFGTGCSQSVCYVYQGPRKPLKNVAVLLLRPNIRVQHIDGYRYVPVEHDEYVDISNFLEGAREYHLLPGDHVIGAYYYEVIGNRTKIGDIYKVFHNFQAGHVYELYLEFFEKAKYAVHIRHIGTVEEFVINKKNVPSHWRELMDSD